MRTLKILVVVFAILVLFPTVSLAQEVSPTDSITPVSTVSAKPTPAPIDYTLPYPGLLPDNPLYFLKAARDRLIEFLISDPEKKAEFYLLSSDKRLNTGYYLILKKKNDLGVLYISKSNNYMHMAIINAKNAAERGKATVQNIKASLKKHEEVVLSLESKVDQKNKSKLADELGRLKGFETLIK